MAPPEPLPGASSGPTGDGSVSGVQPELSASTSAVESNVDGPTRQDFLWHVHEYLNEYVRFADSKAAFAGTIAGAVLAALYGAQAHIPLLQGPPNAWAFSSWLTLLGALGLLACVGLAAWVVAPRLGSSQPKAFIYWQGIAEHCSQDEFRAGFATLSTGDMTDHLLGHVFDLATKVCVPKYALVRWCIWCLCLGALLSGVALVVKDAPVPAVTAPAKP